MASIKTLTASEKYTLFPIKHQSLWDFYKRHEGTFWTVEEVRLNDDIKDWNSKLNDDERFFIKHILAFFAASDGIVNENLVVNFYNEIELPEARAFYTVQMMMETIHSEQYSILIDTYIQDKDEKDKLFNAIETIPVIKRKSDWALKWISSGQDLVIPGPVQDMIRDFFIGEKCLETDTSLNEFTSFTKSKVDQYSFEKRLLAFACVEGIFFSGSFCAIYWLKNKGLMPGLATANQFISRDENLHTEFAIELYKVFGKRLPVETVHSIFVEAVEIEKEFITKSLPVSLLGMNCELMSQYIEYVCDRWLVLLDYPKIYNSRNPFSFMEMISLETKENFFDGDTTEYSRAGITAETSDMEFGLDDDF